MSGFSRDVAFGRCVAVALPAPAEAAEALHPDEAAFARALGQPRRATWIGGRLALRAALRDLGIAAPQPMLATARGAPALPTGAAGSVSHKETIAVALAARADGATLGIDVEIARPARRDISARVLTHGERAAMAGLEPAARARALLVAFAAKEAVYKALDPWVARTIAFREVEIARAGGGALVASLRLARGEGPFIVDIDEVPAAADLVLIAARARPR